MFDEAHSIGAPGLISYDRGELQDIETSKLDHWMDALIKQLVNCSGHLTFTSPFNSYLRYIVPGFVDSVGTASPDARAVLTVLRRPGNEPECVSALQECSALFQAPFKAHDLEGL